MAKSRSKKENESIAPAVSDVVMVNAQTHRVGSNLKSGRVRAHVKGLAELSTGMGSKSVKLRGHKRSAGVYVSIISEKLNFKDFVILSKSGLDNVKTSKIVPGKLGSKSLGHVEVIYRDPVLKAEGLKILDDIAYEY